MFFFLNTNICSLKLLPLCIKKVFLSLLLFMLTPLPTPLLIHFSMSVSLSLFHFQCCEAIRHMHDKRIIHRDIKPSNVFVMEDGSLKLGDLGLGRYLDLQSILAFSQVGTPLYMSPEVLRGEGHHFASDIWSLGCLLYELATLKSPFQEKGLTMDRLFLKIVKGDYAKQAGYSSGRVSRVVESLLNTDPKQRPDIHWVHNNQYYYK